jgi:outer membrane murein-binding lipoprotein Lpp
MKNLSINLYLWIILVVILMCGCASSAKCDAYGKNIEENTEISEV